jgi:hypothetical protein
LPIRTAIDRVVVRRNMGSKIVDYAVKPACRMISLSAPALQRDRPSGSCRCCARSPPRRLHRRRQRHDERFSVPDVGGMSTRTWRDRVHQRADRTANHRAP